MAALMPPPSSTSTRSPKSSKQGRSRPNLSKVCQKTKICSFYLRGLCTRNEACTFAHDESELQAKPDLRCTKPCPELLSTGCCSRAGCTFAHSDAEMRRLDIEAPDASGTEHEHVQPHGMSSVPSLERSFLSTSPIVQKPRTAPLVVSRLNDAAIAGAMTMGDMTLHLARIFLAFYEARPEIADRLNIPAEVLASSTAEKAWADAGHSSEALLSFRDLARWCALPSDLMPQDEALPQPQQSASMAAEPSQAKLKHCNNFKRSGSRGDDSDMWSQCSTEDGSSDLSLSPAGWQTPQQYEDLEDWRDPELKVMNTFIHFSPRKLSNRVRRAQSVPCKSS